MYLYSVYQMWREQMAFPYNHPLSKIRNCSHPKQQQIIFAWLYREQMNRSILKHYTYKTDAIRQYIIK